MIRARACSAAAIVTLAILIAPVGGHLDARQTDGPRPGIDWPSFRGINGSGVAEGFGTPTEWDVPARERVRWTIPLEGLGHASPVIWGDQICVTTAISGREDAGLRIGLYGDVDSVEDDTTHVWKLLCADKTSGEVLFNKTIHEGVPKVKRHMKATHANTTLATDGRHLVAMLGSEGLFVFDMNGEPLWRKDFGILDAGWFMDASAQWGFASSPVIHDGAVVIQADVQDNSFLAAFDVATGTERWRTPRRDVPTFSTPTIHVVDGRTQIIVNGWHHKGAYDFDTGEEIWKLDGGGDIPVPRPVVGHGLVFLTNAHGRFAPVFAIHETATGDIPMPEGTGDPVPPVAWSTLRDGAYMITPVLYDGILYVTKNNGVVSAFDAVTGERFYQARLGEGGGFTASTVAADGKLYFTGEDGDVFVVRAGREFELIASNPLGDIGMATPAISEGVLYFRTARQLIAIGG